MTELPLALYRGQDVKALDRLAIQTENISGYQLMNRAGLVLWQILQTRWSNVKKIIVFCGNGNNGGDGLILARLAKDHGLDVTVYEIQKPNENSTLEATQARQDWLARGNITLYSGQSLDGDLIIDAMLGTGARAPLAPQFQEAIHQINRSRLSVLAVDFPSGLHADTGNNLGAVIRADMTVTFIGLKVGLFLKEAIDNVGEIIFDDLSIHQSLYANIKPCAWRLTHEQVMSALKKRPLSSHKGHFGHVAVIGGGITGYSGAPALAGEAAMRAGAGLVSAVVAPESLPLLARSPRELMCYGPEKVKECETLFTRATVFVVGPGLSQTAWGKQFFQATLTQKKPMIVDADGLNWLAQYPQKSMHWILTPHPAEAARLLNCSVEQVQADRLQAAIDIQQRYGGVIVLKGAGTVIISESGEAVINPGGYPALATAGTGDVLAGLIGGLLAQGLSPMQAALLGVSTHTQAALIEQSFGERGMIASDLLLHIRTLLNTFDTQ
uniref:Bifunctional NAD(P)H-hydrate repair enzyme n=1 Tax=Candidatus Berkiella aquae TaxID=295108 RepID=A0A0Q9YUL9_9GAMM